MRKKDKKDQFKYVKLALAVVEELADTTVVKEVEGPVIQPSSPPKEEAKGQAEKEVEPRKDNNDEDDTLERAMQPLEQSRVPVARGSPPKKAKRKKTAAAGGDDDEMLEKAMRQADEEFLDQKQRTQQLWEEKPGRCLEGHTFLCLLWT